MGLLAAFVGAAACRDQEGGERAGWGGGRGLGGGAAGEEVRLPTAFLGNSYRFDLLGALSELESASARTDRAEPDTLDGRRGRLRWIAGALPRGLLLDANGSLEGTPRAEGEYVFVLADDHARRTRKFTLPVSRKRWVAYRSDERNPGQHLLYVADLGRPGAPRVLLTRDVQWRAEVLPDHYRFAPHEEALAYLVDRSRDGVRELYAVSLEGGRVGAAARVDHGTPVREFAWSPDGRQLAYASQESDGLFAHVVEWPLTGARSVLGRVGPGARLSWVHSDLLLMEAPGGGTEVLRRRDGVFRKEGSLPLRGRVLHARGGRVVFAEAEAFCAETWRELDFAEEVPPGVAREAGVSGLPLAGAFRDGDVSRLVRHEHWVVPGVAALASPPPALDPSERWIVFRSRDSFHVAPLTEPGPEAAIDLRSLPGVAGRAVLDATFVGGALAVLTERDLFFVSLDVEPLRARSVARLSPAEGRPSTLVGGLPDGSWIGVALEGRERVGSGRPPRRVRLVPTNSDHAGREEVLLGAALDCLGEPSVPSARRPARGAAPGNAKDLAKSPARCGSVEDVVFQP